MRILIIIINILKIKIRKLDIKLKLPGKNYFGDNFSTSFVTKRMMALDEFIKNAMSFESVLKL